MVLAMAVGMEGCGRSMEGPRAVLREAPPVELPGVPDGGDPPRWVYDCNNPVHWDGDTMYVISSSMHPYRGKGPDLFNLGRPPQRVVYDNEAAWRGGGRWIEATYKDPESGLLHGWYHHEPPNRDVCPDRPLTAPEIGAIVSEDNGLHWRDLGIVITAPPGSLECATVNGYFAGGNGDFSVILDREGRYFYFMMGTYYRDTAQQGIAVARMAYADRDAPVGRVWKYHEGGWDQPGLGGNVAPIFGVRTDWHREDADALWGPSIHWNTHLGQYVMLLNRAIDQAWKQEGVYISFNPEVADPKGWTEPVRIMAASGSQWYPQVVGVGEPAGGTDKLAGRVTRFFLRGRSAHEIVFLRPGERE